MSALEPGVVYEHAILTRHLGSVQDRVSRLMHEKDCELQALAGEVVRLRAQLVIVRTHQLWGMAAPLAAIGRRNSAPSAPPQELEAARKAICQVGCAGHAHHWRSDEGQCRWSGLACDAGGE